MSTAKYSGIAVAAANRAALERQEAEAERLRAPRAVDARERRLLEHLRATMTAESMLGASTRPERAPETTARADANAVASSSGRAALVAQKAVERASRAAARPLDARAPEKRHMSKAERKRLKRARAARAEGEAEGADDDARLRERATRVDDDGRRATTRRKKTKKP